MTQTEKEEYIKGNGGYTQQELEEAIKHGCEEIKKIMGKESKEQLKNEIKEHRKQAQLELLDEIYKKLVYLPLYISGDTPHPLVKLRDIDEILTKKREQLTSDNKDDKEN